MREPTTKLARANGGGFREMQVKTKVKAGGRVPRDPDDGKIWTK